MRCGPTSSVLSVVEATLPIVLWARKSGYCAVSIPDTFCEQVELGPAAPTSGDIVNTLTSIFHG